MTIEQKRPQPAKLSKFSHADRRMWGPELPPAPNAPFPNAPAPEAAQRPQPPRAPADPQPAPRREPPSPPPAHQPAELPPQPAAAAGAPRRKPVRRDARPTPGHPKPTASAAIDGHGHPAPRKPRAKDEAKALRRRAVGLLEGGAQFLRRNANAAELRRKYRKSLVFLHNRIFDREIERLFFRPTAIAAEAAPDNDPNAPLYRGPAPRLVFNWAMSAAPADLKGYAFVDFRAHRGRAMMLAARRNFEKIIGFEYDDALFDDLQMNVAQFPRSLMACRNVECLRGDRDGVSIPDQPAVLYFANAYRERFMSLIMSHVSTSYRLNPRRIYIMLENPDAATTIGQDDIFYRIPLPPRERALMKLFSPIRIEVYRSLV